MTNTQKSNSTSNPMWARRCLHVCNDVRMDISMLSTAIQEMCDPTKHITTNFQLPNVTLRIYGEETHRKSRCNSGSFIRKVALSFALEGGRTSWRMPFPLDALWMSNLFFVRRSRTASTSASSHRSPQTPTSMVETLVASLIFHEPLASSHVSPATQQRPPPAMAKARCTTHALDREST
jgi:hypothetical protein